MIRALKAVQNLILVDIDSADENMIELKETVIALKIHRIKLQLRQHLHQQNPAARIPGVKVSGKNQRAFVGFDLQDFFFDGFNK